MTSRAPLIWLAFLALVLSGCDSAENLVNRRLPPVLAEQSRATAVQAAQAALAELGDANAGFNLRIEDIAATLNASGLTERLGLAQLRLRGDRQLILAEVDVAKTFSTSDFPDLDVDTKKLIEALKPEIKGRIALGLGLTSANALSDDGRLTIGLRLHPVFHNMEVERVSLAGELDVDLLVMLMNRLAAKLSSELSHVEIARASFPVNPFKQADLSRAIALGTADGVGEKIAFSARPVSSPARLRSVAWLIDGGNVTFLAEIAPDGTSSAASPAAPGKEDYAQLQAEFSEKLMEGLGLAHLGSANWIAVSKQLVAELVNTAVEQGQPCIGVKAALADRTFSRPIEIPGDTEVDCTPKIDCTPVRICDAAVACGRAEDCSQARDCQVCALGACFNDPACEREKAAAAYNCEVREATRKIECERLGAPQQALCARERAEERATCEAVRSGKKLACEAAWQSLEKRAATRSIATLAGTVAGSADISICISKFAAAPSLERLEASAILRGRGDIDLGVKYAPLDIADYLACQFPWTEGKRMKIVLPEQTATLDAPLTLESSAAKPTLKATIKTSALAAQMHPNLRELLLASYDMRAACKPVGAMLHDVMLDVTPSVPEISGDFRLPGEDRALVLTLEPATFDISGTNVVAKAAYAPNAKALILTDDQTSVPAN